jgi:hypothetical protein
MRWAVMLLMLALAACNAPAPAAAPADKTHFVYYLHGKIVEDSGPEGVSPKFGRYDYPGILAALRRPGIGASKGSVIAMLVSTRLQVPGVRYVLLANCNDWVIEHLDPRLSGDVLSIYEASDDLGGSCVPMVKRSAAVGRFSEIRLETGLGHGIVYRPLEAWVTPALDWTTR